MEPNAHDQLVARGFDGSRFRAQELKDFMVQGADLVLTATRAIRGHVVATAPAALKRTFTLLELAALLEAHPWGDDEGDVAEVLARAADWRASVSGLGDDLDVPDPIGGSPQIHRNAADLADRATRVIAAWLG
jgi:protein-tyrosine phosphatase